MEKIKEFINYGFIGLCTTIINYVVYFICLKMNLDWFFSNSLAWLVAVLFAYVFNRKFVFHSNKNMKKECMEFFSLRFLTLIVENILLAICIGTFHLSNLISKVVVSIITVLSNYFLCKMHVFHQEEACYE